MKKILEVLIGSVLLFVCTSCVNLAAPYSYQAKTETGGEIEETYMANGKYDVSRTDQGVLLGFNKFLTFYPSQLSKTSDTSHIYPVIVISNGSGTPLSRYTAVAKHYASWGFIVVGTEEKYDWDGCASEMCLRYLKVLNENKTIGEGKQKKENIFYQKIDFENIGIVGHSQGGVGVLNAITSQQHSSVFKTAVSLSPTNKELAHNLFWDYDATKITIPIMLIAGAGGGDDWVVTGEQLQEIYDDISSKKVMLRRKDTSHGLVLYSANGYVMAWFMWQLQGDEEAAKAFIGENPEILNNELYQDQKVNME